MQLLPVNGKSIVKINPKRKEEWQQKSKGEKVVVAGACHSLPAPFLVIRYV
jgi:primosomal protein N'